MNLLAHLLLSCEDEDLMIGNFIADFIRNKEVANYSETIQKGIFLHRKIDTFTDTHPLFRQGTKRLHSEHGKYAPVILDVLYDYILCQNWDQYSTISIIDFTQKAYEILTRRLHELPQKLQTRLPIWIENDWLIQYGTEDGLRFTFQKMDERTKFPSHFVDAVDHLKAYYDLYEAEFNLFFPALIALVEEECGE